MRCRYLGAVPFLTFILALPCAAAPTKQTPQNALDADKLAPGQFTGTLLTAPGTDRTFTVRVRYQELQLKPNSVRTSNAQAASANRQLQQIARLQQQMARSKNPAQQLAQIQRLLAQMQVNQLRTQQNLFNVVTRTQDVEFQAEEGVKVRTLELPDAFDEKGNIKRFTREELKQLKGKDTHLPGYESSFENLRAGQLVQVTLASHKAPAKPTAGSEGKSKDGKEKDAPALDKALEKDKGGTDKAADKDSDKHKQVRLIVILKEDAGPAPRGKR